MRRTRWWSLLMLIVWSLTACTPRLPWQPTSPTPVAEDVWPPVVTAYQPASGQEVALDTVVVLRFDQPMERKRTEAAFTIEPSTSGTFLWQDVRTLIFRPRAPLQAATVYHVRLDDSARALSGATLQRPLDFTFITQTPLQVTQIYPPNGATNLRVDSAILIGFNRAVVPETCIGEVAGNRTECPTLPASVTPAVLTRGTWIAPALYRLSPYPGWNAGTTYTLTLRGTITAWDASTVQTEVSSRFSVAQVQVARIEPLDRQTTALPPDTTLRITFNHPMDSQATAEAFSLTKGDGTPVPGTLAWEAEDTVLVFKPLQPLELATRYVARLSNRARAITTAPLPQGQQWIFETIPAPEAGVVYPPNGAKDIQPHSSVRFALQGAWDEATLRTGLIISPTVPTFDVTYQSGALAVQWNRAPRTTYCVELPAGLRDTYGQVLNQGAKTCFSTADLPMTFEPVLAEDTLLIDAASIARLSFFARNVTRVSFQLYRVDELSFMTNAPTTGTPLRDWVERFTVTDPNVVQVVNIDIMRGNPLRSGYYQLQWSDPATGNPRRVRLAVVDRHLNLILGREEAQVWVSDLHATTPITGVQVRLLERGVLLAAGTTNAEGLVQLRFEPRTEIHTPLFAVTGEPGTPGFGLVSTAWHTDVAAWDFGLTAQYDAFPTYTVWAFTDRQLYRPQETIAFAGLVRQRNDATYELPKKLSRIQVSLTPTLGKNPVYSDTVRVSDHGFFEGFILLPRSVEAGRYILRIGEVNGASFWQNHLDILPLQTHETFHIYSLLAQHDLPLFTPVTVTMHATYPNGMPVAHANGKLTVWRWEDANPQLFADIPLQTDVQGQLTFALPRPPVLPTEPETWLLRVTLKDVEGHVNTLNTVVRVHPAPMYPEVRLSAHIGKMRQTMNAQVRAVAWDGMPVAGIPLTVTLVQRTWRAPTAITSYLADTWEAQESVVDTKTLVSGNDWSTVSLFPPMTGDYVVRVTSSITREVSLSVTGNEEGSWRQGTAQLVPVADKTSYRAGETAQVLLPLATANPCRVLMTVMRNGVVLRRFYDFTEAAPIIGLPISQEFVPDVYVTFTAFCSGTAPQVKSGTLHLAVQPVLQTLRMEIATDRTVYAPQETVNIKLRVRDAGDRPVEGAQILLAVTESLPGLPLSNALIETFYRHPLRLIGGDTFNVLMERWAPLVKSLEASSLAIWLKTRITLPKVSNVPQWPGDSFPQGQSTLLWQPSLVADAAGEVNVSFQLPARNTTWLVRAFAVSGPTQMGEAQRYITSTEPIRLVPQLPTALHAGDLITVGVHIDNLTTMPLTPTLALMVEGATLLNTPVTTVSLSAQSTTVYTWTLKAPEAGVGEVALRYEARLPSASTVVVTRTLPVQATESIVPPVLIGALRDETPWRSSFYVPAQAEVGSALHVNLYPSLTRWLDAQTNRLTGKDNDADTEAVALRLLALTSVQGDSQSEIETLYRYQNKDGGWGAWGGDETSTLYESALVMWALTEARSAGQTVDADVLKNGLEYVAKALSQTLGSEKQCTPDHALGLLALTAAQYRWPQETPQQLYTCRQSLGITGQAYLALALGEVDRADSRLKALLSGLNNAARADGTWYEMDARYHITSERATAVSLLALATLQPGHKLLPAALMQALAPTLPERERALSLMALKRYLTAMPETNPNNGTWDVTLNGRQLTAYQADQGAVQLVVPLAQLQPDATQTLAFHRTEGEGPLYYEAYLTLDLPATNFAGGIQVERLYCLPHSGYASLCEPATTLSLGDEVEVRLRLTVPSTRTQVLLTETLPAGAMFSQENVYGALNPFKHTAFGRSVLQLYAPSIPAGMYEVRYRLRAVFPGRFTTLPAVIRELYGEPWGRSEEGQVNIIP